MIEMMMVNQRLFRHKIKIHTVTPSFKADYDGRNSLMASVMTNFFHECPSLDRRTTRFNTL